MLNIILGFGGRIGRLHYLLLSLLLGFVMTLLTLAIVFGMMPHYTEVGGKVPDGMPAPVLVATMLVVTPLFLWFSFALQTKRIRDIGWNPLLVIPAWIVVDIVAVLAGSPTFSGCINLTMVAVLLFWPSREPDQWSPPSFGSSEPVAERVAWAAPEVQRVPQPPARRGFGRKGM